MNANETRSASRRAFNSFEAESAPTTLLSPLRYPGSKRRLAPFIEKIIRANGLNPDLYVEPFAGGASVALHLLAADAVEKIGLTDRDPLVASFWQTVFFNPGGLIRRIKRFEVTHARWYALKKSEPRDLVDRAFKCLILNRTSFSGILAKNAGPLGGKNPGSLELLNSRLYRSGVIERIENAHSMRKRVAFVWNASWDRALNIIKKRSLGRIFPKNVLYYFDPPFFEKADRLYNFFFASDEHETLRDALSVLKAPWLLSYDSPHKARKLYSSAGVVSRSFQMTYSASATPAFRKSEILISNLGILPRPGAFGTS